MEDLWAFNEEVVARAIRRSAIPVISDVGHEIDLTIADMAADLRAATPSAAAELTVRKKVDLVANLGRLTADLVRAMEAVTTRARSDLTRVRNELGDPSAEIAGLRIRLDDLDGLLDAGLQASLGRSRQQWLTARGALLLTSPLERIRLSKAQLTRSGHLLSGAVDKVVAERRRVLAAMAAALDGMSPLAVLGRGYSIVRKSDSGNIVRRADQVEPGEQVRVQLHEGGLICRVEDVEDEVVGE